METITLTGVVTETVDLGGGLTNYKLVAPDGSELWVTCRLAESFGIKENSGTMDAGAPAESKRSRGRPKKV